MQRRARLASREDNAAHGPRPRLTWTPDTAIVAIELAAARCPSSRCPAIRSSLRPCRNSAGSTGTGVRPQIPGFSPGGLGPHLTASGFPSGLSSGFPLPTRALPFVRLPPVSLRPALSGSVPSAVAVRFGSPSVSLRVPFPLSNLHVSAAARRFCGRWSRTAGTKVTSSRRDPWLRSRRSARTQMFPGSGSGRAARRAAASPPALRIRDDPSWRPGPGSFQRRARQAREVRSTPFGDVGPCSPAGHRNGLGEQAGRAHRPELVLL